MNIDPSKEQRVHVVRDMVLQQLGSGWSVKPTDPLYPHWHADELQGPDGMQLSLSHGNDGQLHGYGQFPKNAFGGHRSAKDWGLDGDFSAKFSLDRPSDRLAADYWRRVVVPYLQAFPLALEKARVETAQRDAMRARATVLADRFDLRWAYGWETNSQIDLRGPQGLEVTVHWDGDVAVKLRVESIGTALAVLEAAGTPPGAEISHVTGQNFSLPRP